MATKLISSTLVLLCFAATLHHATGCSCVKNPEFCESDFAIRGTILDVQGNYTAQEDLIYSVMVDEVYRNSSEGILVTESLEIETGGHTCGVGLLDIGTIYLISGLYNDNSDKYSMDSCNSVIIVYNDADDVSDLDLPCSASLTTSMTSYILVIGAFLHFILQ
ncbi:uncharacterized protein LOC129273076 [Lytechinus pictus]|uniref:uncharacterized protein LOC129273076 n=1 Tax=Lytechinus pictus TaxID=7653 RepID=UPI0030B9E7DA